jgi:hypothetical protein
MWLAEQNFCGECAESKSKFPRMIALYLMQPFFNRRSFIRCIDGIAQTCHGKVWWAGTSIDIEDVRSTVSEPDADIIQL